MKRLIASLAAMAALAACVTTPYRVPQPVAPQPVTIRAVELISPPPPPPDDEANRDGRSMEAKPGLGRLYVVHGNFYPLPEPAAGPATGPRTEKSPVSAAGVTNPIALLLLFGVAAAYEGVKPRQPVKTPAPPPQWQENTSSEDYWLGERHLGALTARQYIAVDLPPGDYTVAFRKPDSGALQITLRAAEVAYVWSLATSENGTIMPCPTDCPERIQKSSRVIVNGFAVKN